MINSRLSEPFVNFRLLPGLSRINVFTMSKDFPFLSAALFKKKKKKEMQNFNDLLPTILIILLIIVDDNFQRAFVYTYKRVPLVVSKSTIALFLENSTIFLPVRSKKKKFRFEVCF